MTDIKITDGDVAVDSAGRFVRLNEKEAQFQRAWICMTAKLGSFLYDRGLGARGILQSSDENYLQRLELILNEALARFENTYAEVTGIGEKVMVKITIDGESIIKEMQLDG